MRKLRNIYETWTYPIPIYITREGPRGQQGTITVGAWAMLPVVLLVQVNALLWGIVGIVKAIGILF
jgi:hypothetical protein